MTTSETPTHTSESADDVDATNPVDPEAQKNAASVDTAATTYRRRHGKRLRVALIALLTVLLVIAGGFAIHFGMRVADDNRISTAQAQAGDAARSFALTMVSYDATGMDTYVQKVLAGSTGELKDTFTRTSAGLKDTLAKAGVKSTGRVLDLATKSSTASRVELVAVVQQSASNTTVTAPQEAVNVLQMTMEKVDGRWLASSVKNPSTTAP